MVRKVGHKIVSRIWQTPPLTDVADVTGSVVTPEEIAEYLDSSDEDSESDNATYEDEAAQNHNIKRVWCICGKSKLAISTLLHKCRIKRIFDRINLILC